MNARLLLLLAVALPALAAAQVTETKTPDGGLQPKVYVDTKGVTHLITYRGDARSGDVFYARRVPGEKAFSKAIQVNSIPGSAIAAGTIRGAQLAVDGTGRPHVVWNGLNDPKD